MKKIISVLFVLILLLSVSACSGNNSGAPAADSSSESSEPAPITVEDIDSALQGEWKLGDQGSFYFEKGNLSIVTGGQVMDGTYDIDMENSVIVGSIVASNDNLSIKLPYSLDDGSLLIFNNKGEALVKQ